MLSSGRRRSLVASLKATCHEFVDRSGCQVLALEADALGGKAGVGGDPHAAKTKRLP